MLALVLCGPACRVTTACHGAQALKKIATPINPFDVVITDHQMPQCPGLRIGPGAAAHHFRGNIVVPSAHLNEINVHADQT